MKDLVKIIREALFSSTNDSPITLYTGKGGYIEVFWRMKGIKGTIPCRYWTDFAPKYAKQTVHLINKKGFLKLVIGGPAPSISIRYGTREIGRTHNFDDIEKYLFNC